MEETGAFVAAMFITKSGSSYWSSYTMMASVLANFGPNSRLYCVREIFAVTDNRENFLTAKISRYTVVITTVHRLYIIMLALGLDANI